MIQRFNLDGLGYLSKNFKFGSVLLNNSYLEDCDIINFTLVSPIFLYPIFYLLLILEIL